MLHIDLKLFDGVTDACSSSRSTTCPQTYVDSSSSVTSPIVIDSQRIRACGRRALRGQGHRRGVARPGRRSGRCWTLVPVENIAFGRAHNRLHFPRAMFDEPLPQADAHTLESVRGPVRCADAAQRTTSRHHRGGALQAVSGVRPLSLAARGRRRARRAPAHTAPPARRGGHVVSRAAERGPLHPWPSTCCATSASRSRRCQSGWATPTPRRSATRSNGGTAAAERVPSTGFGQGAAPWEAVGRGHRPSALAASISRWPACRIRPASMRRCTRSNWMPTTGCAACAG